MSEEKKLKSRIYCGDIHHVPPDELDRYLDEKDYASRLLSADMGLVNRINEIDVMFYESSHVRGDSIAISHRRWIYLKESIQRLADQRYELACRVYHGNSGGNPVVVLTPDDMTKLEEMKNV